MTQKKYAEAIGAFENGIHKAPDNSKNYYQVGHTAVLGKLHVQEGIGDLQNTSACPTTGTRKHPPISGPTYRLGMLYGLAGDKADERPSIRRR